MSANREQQFQDRRSTLIDFFADRTGDDYTVRVGLFEVAAILCRIGESRSGVSQSHTADDAADAYDASVSSDATVSSDASADIDRCVAILNKSLADPHGDMFWMLPMATVHVLGTGILPPDILQRMRSQWQSYTPYRGDTENHWLMYHAAMLIMNELYPDDPPESWFNGRSSQENRAEATSYLKHWFRLVFRSGQNEFDSPHYLPMYLAPLALIHGFSRNEAMRLEAVAMLDLLIVDFAADSLNGLYVGSFSRIYPQPLLERARNPSTTFAWLLFGNIEFRPDPLNIILPRTGYRPHAVAVVLAASGYQPREALFRAATERSKPYVHRELKRSRNHLRYAQQRFSEVYKYSYVCSDFAMGSIATTPVSPGTEMQNGTGLVQPIQQHTWELLWSTGESHDKFNMLFALHPNSSAYEMGLYFPEEPRMMTKLVISQEKPTYDAADKWTGGSPFEQVFQHEKCIVALYNLPDDARHPFISAFFSSRLGELVEYQGWLIATVADVYIAYYPLAPFEWIEEKDGHRRLHSAVKKNGCIVQCDSRSLFDNVESFCEALRRPTVRLDPVPSVVCTTLAGNVITSTYGEVSKVDDRPVDYARWPVFDGPFVRSARGSGTVELISEDGSTEVIRLE